MYSKMNKGYKSPGRVFLCNFLPTLVIPDIPQDLKQYRKVTVSIMFFVQKMKTANTMKHMTACFVKNVPTLKFWTGFVKVFGEKHIKISIIKILSF